MVTTAASAELLERTQGDAGHECCFYAAVKDARNGTIALVVTLCVLRLSWWDSRGVGEGVWDSSMTVRRVYLVAMRTSLSDFFPRSFGGVMSLPISVTLIVHGSCGVSEPVVDADLRA